MATPDFILQLRAKIGHDLLWMPGVTAVVLDADDRLLLVRRADNGRWSLPAGILEPGEQPAEGIVREIQEETGVEAEVERLISVVSLPPSVYPNGDRVQYLDLAFRCRSTGGQARVNDDESTDVGWFRRDDLPDLTDQERWCLAEADRTDPGPWLGVPPRVFDGSSHG